MLFFATHRLNRGDERRVHRTTRISGRTRASVDTRVYRAFE